MAFADTGPATASPAQRNWKAACLALALTAAFALPVRAENPSAQEAPKPAPIPIPTAQPLGVNIKILYVKENRSKELPLSLLDQPNPDDGIAGAKLGIADNNTTGRFLNQTFTMDVLEGDIDELIKGATEKLAGGDSFIIADVEPDSLLKLSDALAGKPAQIFNVGNPDDRLREEDCRPNVMHTAPTRTMLADALTQYLVWKRWPNWLLVVGPSPKDQLLADAYRRSAKKFGAKIVEERQFKIDTGNRRADGGYEQIQQQIPQFMQGAKDHDVVLVVDEDEVFADYFPYRTWVPRPIVGSAGLVPSSWHPALELWGGTQFQNRFKKLSGRIMRPIDYDAWVATRAVGEAASRKQTSDFKTLHDYMHSPNFDVAAFKGVATSFRAWNGQFRQPLLVSTPKHLVSVSPQQGFLHQFSVLDTLGIDKPETKCKAYTQ
ncbi:ABC transporter substrate-binding protein [Hyphomicrobium sp.]|uniref:ABC transporter substrate-binding protein n=1 Tax=Hyphomicrobium sp. TaxID=82 RepID=UPI0025BCAC03|nr:ABC transporter substrate-binding protein [Hyphomicrobium sp.]